ncbi:TPA: hypothetical protein ACPY8E_000315 [Yersinia enterocolitica]|uniref:hypothetical protein n=1 Tax=Yersinia enterocolitica TaxID=630 RepID=UPI0030D324A4|nr:hypothetical protein [Yersinia enterocolitica]HDL7718716.1 hypothetical protein [Yersinia enterocolitica]
MDAFTTFISFFASILGIIGYVSGLKFKGRKYSWIVPVLLIPLFCGLFYFAYSYSSELKRINKVERAADVLASEHRMLTSTGFNMAALAFLEKNKDLYPESYARALQLCESNLCLGAKEGNPKVDSLSYTYNQLNVAYGLHGLLIGISRLEGNGM